ncbi:helix-turn-helix transcriptional regulator [Tahibacter soli]|uniref:Helix-turn-helix transcriptional regulator n=1 Tax=Tahibacter soli TaxID=2983605 RepID=A0A9X3YJT1_9GAMM|nr:helix-turn-helix transcriptional regulator [Tahibacter soli]MDC8012470.1 helix-turn-helix transcriptional regulator [Tahibacter soli]
MAALVTTRDIGLAIRRRRKELGWDQARLAQAAGTSRQWIVDIEQGKPRAELERVLRTLAALDLSLTVEAHETPARPAPSSRTITPRPPIDIDAIVERASRPPALPDTVHTASAAKRR